MLKENLLKDSIKSAVQSAITDFKTRKVKTVTGLSVSGDTVEKQESETDEFPEGQAEAKLVEAIAEGVAKGVVDAFKNGLEIEGVISELKGVHTGNLVGTGGGVPGPVVITSGIIKCDVGKVKLKLGKITS